MGFSPAGRRGNSREVLDSSLICNTHVQGYAWSVKLGGAYGSLGRAAGFPKVSAAPLEVSRGRVLLEPPLGAGANASEADFRAKCTWSHLRGRMV